MPPKPRRSDANGRLRTAATSLLALSSLALLLIGASPATALGNARLSATDTDTTPPALASNASVQEAIRVFETWVEAERQYQSIPGIAMGIVHDQELVWSRGFGYAHRERKAAATADTLFSICSISKLFTSIALMDLVEAGKVDLDTPVSAYLPWFRIQQAYEGAPPITPRGLLTHSSGLPRESAHAYWDEPDFRFPTHEEIVATVSGQQTLYPASSVFQYSNLGLSLAGEIVAAVSGLSYADYVQGHVLTPLGLTDTYSEIPAQHRGGKLATGYARKTREGERAAAPFFQARGIAPAAGYASNVVDLARFLSWQLRLRADHRAGTEGEEVLLPNTLREMQRVQWVDPDWETTWGLGFVVAKVGEGDTSIGHGGSCPGFRTQISIDPKSKIGVVFLSNAMVGTGNFIRQAQTIVGKRLQTAAEAGEKPPTQTAAATGEPQIDLGQFTGIYADLWGESAMVEWEGQLASFSLPSDRPLEGMEKFRHIEGDRFRRVRDDGELGEDLIFDRDEHGRVSRARQHGNSTPRVSPLLPE